MIIDVFLDKISEISKMSGIDRKTSSPPPERLTKKQLRMKRIAAAINSKYFSNTANASDLEVIVTSPKDNDKTSATVVSPNGGSPDDAVAVTYVNKIAYDDAVFDDVPTGGEVGNSLGDVSLPGVSVPGMSTPIKANEVGLLQQEEHKLKEAKSLQDILQQDLELSSDDDDEETIQRNGPVIQERPEKVIEGASQPDIWADLALSSSDDEDTESIKTTKENIVQIEHPMKYENKNKNEKKNEGALVGEIENEKELKTKRGKKRRNDLTNSENLHKKRRVCEGKNNEVSFFNRMCVFCVF